MILAGLTAGASRKMDGCGRTLALRTPRER
jgi:hypothetical protein